MSKSFHQRVEAEIRRRENVRLKEAAEKEKARCEKSKAEIMQEVEREKAKCESSKAEIMEEFEISLKINMQNLEDFYGFYVRAYNASYMFYTNAVELGFTVVHNSQNQSTKYTLTVPAFEKGNKRTPAQLRLLKFERDLAKARKQRKTELLAECNRVKNAINEGNFSYSFANNSIISVNSTVNVSNCFEKAVVSSFFYKLKISFNYSDGNIWLLIL